MRSKLAIHAVGITLLSVASGTCLAEGFYAGAGIGRTQVEDSDEGYIINDFPMGTKIFAGFDVNRGLAIEAAVFDNDTAVRLDGPDETRVDVSGFAVYGLGGSEPGPQGHFFVKAGFFTASREVVAPRENIDDRTSGITAGFGFTYELADFVAIRGDFDTYLSKFDALSSATIGFQIQFGR